MKNRLLASLASRASKICNTTASSLPVRVSCQRHAVWQRSSQNDTSFLVSLFLEACLPFGQEAFMSTGTESLKKTKDSRCDQKSPPSWQRSVLRKIAG